jgi:hypothetical protein
MPTRPPQLYTIQQQAAAVWSGALDVRHGIEQRAERLRAQVEVMNRQHGSAAVLQAIRDGAPRRRDAWQVMSTIARQAADAAAGAVKLILDELCRFAPTRNEPRYQTDR